MWRFFCKKNFSSPWCCCVRHKDSPEDRLQSKARTRLYRELDVMQIIQKLRVARFVSELELSEEQRYLVNYHGEYMLFRNDDIAPAFNANRYTDFRPEDPVEAKRDNRRRIAVQQAIQKLQHDDPKHMETYKRIMARNRPEEDAIAAVRDVNDDGNPGNDGGQPPNAGYRQVADGSNDQLLLNNENRA